MLRAIRLQLGLAASIGVLGACAAEERPQTGEKDPASDSDDAPSEPDEAPPNSDDDDDRGPDEPSPGRADAAPNGGGRELDGGARPNAPEASTPSVDAARPQITDASLSADSASAVEAGRADASSEAGAPSARADAGPSPFARAFHIPLRVHRADSGLTGAAIASVLEEVNEIWWKQAAICFEIEVVRNEELRRDGFDFWFHRSRLGCGATGNGVYCGDHDIHSLDMPNLNRADNAPWDTRQNAARTTAHELGHGLSLDHYNGFADSNDSLMSSGRQGFKLHENEVNAARMRAQQKALMNSPSTPCAPVPVVD